MGAGNPYLSAAEGIVGHNAGTVKLFPIRLTNSVHKVTVR